MEPESRVIRPAQVELDLAEAAEFLGQDNPDVGLRFFQAAEDTFRHLVETPGLGGPYESSNARLRTLRVWPVSGFDNWLIFFRPTRNGIVVARVIHGARDIENILDQ